MSYYNTNFIANINGTYQDLGNIFYNWSSNTVNIPSTGKTLQRYTIRYKKPTILLESDITVSMDGYPQNGDQVFTFGPQVQNRFVFLGSGNNGAAFSNEGVIINPLGDSNIVSNSSSACFWDGMKWVGNSRRSNTANTTVSYDGIYWTYTGTNSLPSGFDAVACQIIYNGSIYVIAGAGGGAASGYSYDGLNWTAATGLASGLSFRCLGWNGVTWLIGGTSSTYLYYSLNGINWLSTTHSFTSVYDIAWIGDKWVACGTISGGYTIAYTTVPTGASGWTTATTSNIFGIRGARLKWNGSVLVLSGITTNTLGYSYDGIIWVGNGATIFPTQQLGPLAWSGKMFMAGGNNNTNGIAYSYNGINWVGLGTSIMGLPGSIEHNSRRPHSITCQRRLTVAVGVGSGTTIAYSLDGITWTSYANTGVGSAGIAYNGKMWVTGSYLAGNSVAFSKNGFTWNHVPGSARVFETGSMQGLTWNGTIFVAAATTVSATTGNCLAFSYDGVTWLPALNTLTLFAATNSSAWCISSTPSLIIAGGNGAGTLTNTLAYSRNGYNWTGLGIINSSTTCYGIANNGRMWIAGFNNGLAYSMDGFTWSATANNPFSSLVRGIANNGKMWVAVGSGTTSTSTAYSYNGINWTSGTCTNFTNGLGVTWNGTLWVASGNGGTNALAYSFNGITWTGITGMGIFSSYAYGLASNYGIQPKPFIQHPTLAFSGKGNTISYSPDGMNWTGLGKTVFSSGANCGFWNGKIWVAGGSGSGGNTLAYSYDGVNWSGLGKTFLNTGNTFGVCYNGSIWVAVGQNGTAGSHTIAYSYTGLTWNIVANSAQIFTGWGLDIKWNGNTWLATGNGGNAIATSSNGIVWTGISTSYNSVGLNYCATSGTLWVAAVNSSIGLVYTTDITGKTGWTSVASNPFGTGGGGGVAWNGAIWVAGGGGSTNVLAYSTNGTTWSTVANSTTTFPGGIWNICWNGTRFVATGQNTSYMGYSPDGIIWYSGNYSNIVGSCRGIASNSGVGAFIAPSALVLNDYGISGNAMTASQTLEIVSSDPYFQQGFNNVTVKIETDNIY